MTIKLIESSPRQFPNKEEAVSIINEQLTLLNIDPEQVDVIETPFSLVAPDEDAMSSRTAQLPVYAVVIRQTGYMIFFSCLGPGGIFAKYRERQGLTEETIN